MWTEASKHASYRDSIANALWTGYAGSLGPASAAVLAEHAMVASVCAGQTPPEDAAAEAPRRAGRYYN